MMDSPALPALANDNADPFASATGAYLRLLRVRARLLNQSRIVTTPTALESRQRAIREIDGVLRKIRPFL